MNLIDVVIGIILLLILAFEIYMFMDMIQNEEISQTNKIIWACAMLLLHPFVAIYYYFTARRNRV